MPGTSSSDRPQPRGPAGSDTFARPGEGERVTVTYRKFDGALHWHEQRFALGRDTYGTWLGAGPNTPSQRGHEPVVIFAEPSVMLIPDGLWWSAVFNDVPARIAIYCDITTVPVFTRPVDCGPMVSMVDLDLDVVQARDGTPTFIDDEDEFAEHSVLYGYPTEVAEAARQSADSLLATVRDQRPPFAGEHLPYLERARSLPERIGP